ncbi:MAG: aminoacyl-tRNA hydrolase [Clostridia bacterium]|nr:aminoacyl-tRNA hydrolase [Clostridia bacterium]
MKVIVGLGNPGKEYDKTYHNLGFMLLDKLAAKLGVSFNKANKKSVYVQTKIDDQIVFLLKPQTYMNLSGQAVKEFVKFYKLQPSDVVVICDDIDLPKGVTRYRENGSGGTHNGLKNIVFELKSENFKRVKIGCAKDNDKMDLKDYVLSKIDEESYQLISSVFDEAINKILNAIK